MSVDLERELNARLRQRSTEAPVGDGWEAIHRRIDARRRARQRRRLAGCGVAAIVALVASVALLGDSDREARVATRPPDSAAGEPELPRLVLDLPGWEVDRASTEDTDAGPRVAPPLWLFTEPGRGFDGKVVYVTIADPTVPYGLGDENPAATRVDIRGSTGYLNVTPPWVGEVGQIGWRTADGTSVYLTSTRLSEEELVAIARLVDVAADRTLMVPDGPLPAGLAFERGTAPGEWDGRVRAQISHRRRGGGAAELRLQTGGEWLFDEVVRDRLVSASASRSATVQGAPGVVTTYQGPGQHHSVLWMVRPGVVAELRADDVSADEAVAVAQSVKEVEEQVWRDLVARFSTEPPVPNGIPSPGRDRHEQVVSALCELRGAWLAGTSGDVGRADVEERVRELRTTAAAEDLGRNSDILVVLDDLVEAMHSGHAAAVRSIPAGGCR
jgi:hypothetical protein